MRQLHDFLKDNPNFFDQPTTIIQKRVKNRWSARQPATEAQVRYARALLRSRKLPEKTELYYADDDSLRALSVGFIGALIDQLKLLPFRDKVNSDGIRNQENT